MGIPYTPELGRGGRRCDRRMPELWAGERLPGDGGTAAHSADVRTVAPGADLRAACRSEFVALAGRKADGYLARPALGPSLPDHGRLDGAATDAGRDPRASRRPATCSRWSTRPGARRQPGEARTVRDLHDVRARRCLAPPSGLRPRAARPDRRRLASRGVPRGRQAHPGRAARRLHALRHARGCCRRRSALPGRGGLGAAAPPAGRPGGGADRRAAGLGQDLRRESDTDDRRAGIRASAGGRVDQPG